jgi:hypothetical protein
MVKNIGIKEKNVTKSRRNMKDLIVKNFKTIVFIVFGLFILYWMVYIITPNVKMSEDDKAKIDSLNNNIKKYEEQNKKLDSSIIMYVGQISKIDSAINNIKKQKTIIKEFYHEKIISVDTFSRTQIDDFFSKRYGHHP